jgi:hypothetical protein
MPVGSLGHIGIAKEVTFGTPVAAADYIPFVSESVVANIEQIISESNRGIYDESPSYAGGKTYAGDIIFDVHPASLGFFLRSALGAPVTTQPDAVGAPTVYSHVFKPVQAPFNELCHLPPYTLEIHRDAASAWRYTSAVVNQLQLQVSTSQKIMRGTASLIAKSGSTLAATTPSLETSAPFLWNQLAVSLGGSSYAAVEDITIIALNNLEGIMTMNADSEISRIKRNGKRQFTLNMTIDFGDAITEYTNFINQTEQALDLVFTGANISGTFDNSLTLNMPKVRYTAYPVNIGGPGRLTVAVAAAVKYDAVSGYALQATLQNTKVSY